MGDWNEQAAPNNNFPPSQIQYAQSRKQPPAHEFSEELSDGGERNAIIESQKRRPK